MRLGPLEVFCRKDFWHGTPKVFILRCKKGRGRSWEIRKDPWTLWIYWRWHE